jgi:hypothetical protein
MTASCLSTPFASPARYAHVPPRVRRVPLALALVLVAALLAPEQPIAQADICQRHNGAAACRVW